MMHEKIDKTGWPQWALDAIVDVEREILEQHPDWKLVSAHWWEPRPWKNEYDTGSFYYGFTTRWNRDNVIQSFVRGIEERLWEPDEFGIEHICGTTTKGIKGHKPIGHAWVGGPGNYEQVPASVMKRIGAA